MMLTLQCEWCGATVMRTECVFLRNGPHVFCGRKCSSERRQQHKTDSQKRAAKADYDREYRAQNLRRIRRKKKAYFQRTYDPAKAAVERKKNMPRHVEYCRSPEYRKWKHRYDVKYNAKRAYGDFGESFILLKKIENEVGKRMSDYEIRLQQGTLNKRQTRTKQLQRS